MVKTTKARAAAALDAILAGINDTGTPAAGSINFYTGSPPANPNEGAASTAVLVSPTGTLLAACDFLVPASNAFAAADPGTLTAEATEDGSGNVAHDGDINASGTVGYFRIVDHAGNHIHQGTAGGPGSGKEIVLSSATLTENGELTIDSLTASIGGIV